MVNEFWDCHKNDTLLLAESTCSCEMKRHAGVLNLLETKLFDVSKAKPSIFKNYQANVQFLDLTVTRICSSCDNLLNCILLTYALFCICHIVIKSFRLE